MHKRIVCVCAREQENGRRTGREPNGENEEPKNRTSPTKRTEQKAERRTERQLPFERMRTFSKPFRCAFELRLDEHGGSTQPGEEIAAAGRKSDARRKTLATESRV